MTIRANPRFCPQCGTGLEAIQIIDKADYNIATDLQYRAMKPEKGWLGLPSFPVQGNIRAWMCPSCGRVSLFAEPKPAKRRKEMR